MRTKRFGIAGLVLGMAVCLAPSALAGPIAVNFTTGSFHQGSIGWDGVYQDPTYDILDVTGLTSTMTLDAGHNNVLLNDFSYSAGLNSYSSWWEGTFSLTRDLTFFGKAIGLSQLVDATVSSYDTLTISDGGAVSFDVDGVGSFVITPLGHALMENGGGTQYGQLYADVDYTPVPEPASMMLLGTGLIGLAGAARRRFRKQ